MTSKKKSASKPKSRAKAKKPAAAKSASKREPVDTGVRQLVSSSVVTSLATEQEKCLSRSATAGQDFSTEMKKAQERGLNPVSFRLATRLTRMAKRDSAKALVCYEDFIYYLECLGFEKMASKPMFPAHEVRSGKKASGKKNGATKKGQTDIEHDTALVEQPAVDPLSGPHSGQSEEATESVH